MYSNVYVLTSVNIVSEDNTRDFVTSGGVKQVARISVESNREDIRNLAKKILRLNRTFQAEV